MNTSDHQHPDAGPAVTIVGSGFSGLGMAIRLKKSGMDDFVILEKEDDIGGTWRDNSYPGCGCDVQSHLYSFSFELNPAWSRTFARQEEIWDYLRHCADKYELWPHIRFGAALVRSEFDEETGAWLVTTNRGETFTSRAVVLGTGPLHQPAYPNVPGMEKFEGRMFHSAQWDHSYDLTGKRVAVIGTGASAIQFVPQIATRVEQLHLFQRTPPWVMPKPDHPISGRQQQLFRRFPVLQRLRRDAIYWQLEGRVLGFTHPALMKLVEAGARRFIRRHIRDPWLREAVTPDYRMGCKRVLMSNDYYPTLDRENVNVVTGGLAEVRENSVVTRDGTEHPVDAIIFGTGFHVSDAFEHLEIVGSGGAKIQDTWRDGIEAYLGVTVSGFPNLFFLLGPNSGLAHNSMVFMVESQVNYVMSYLRTLFGENASYLDLRAGEQRRFNRRLQQRLASTVWNTGGCNSWYLDANGRNSTLWPGFTVEYWLRTRRMNKDDYEIKA